MIHAVTVNSEIHRFDMAKVVCITTTYVSPDETTGLKVYLSGLEKPFDLHLDGGQYNGLLEAWGVALGGHPGSDSM